MLHNIRLDKSWKEALASEFEQPYFKDLVQHLKTEKQRGIAIYPPGSLIFNALDSLPFHQVKAVILGQDPYHGPGQAMGLSFSVPRGMPIPASLRNIYRELQMDTGLSVPSHGDLTSWTQQGVLLLNSVLTVRHREAGSHQHIGWQSFTDAIISLLSYSREHLIFMLWGNYARSKKSLIDANRHLILEAAHPSPLARGAFFGCRHFSKCNDYLVDHKLEPIDWAIH